MPLPRSVVRSMFLRSFAIQGSWNYRTLLGSGFAYALLPVLRHVYAGDDVAFQEAVERHTSLFNAHPYLAGVALGAVARMEADGEDPALIERFKTALRGSLGTLGDRIVWAGWRPACVLLGLVVLLGTHSAAMAMIVFLSVYNAGHIALRWWGLSIGVEHGRNVGEQLRRAPLMTWHERVVSSAAFLLGTALPLIGAGALTDSTLHAGWLAVPAAAAAAGWALGGSIRMPALVLLSIATIAGFLFRLI
ncbi:MAG TPA: PTS system mannose/fructose/sorbose family transporter subunit IID [Longimicrobiales bacterium]|nr:PTS system mannose/fructose/sorbose family transporter subunit IID [Longimicrobiales bacterium]